MNTGIFVICRDDSKIITAHCESWFKLIQFIEKYQGMELYCTISPEDWFSKLYEWRNKQCHEVSIVTEN